VNAPGGRIFFRLRFFSSGCDFFLPPTIFLLPAALFFFRMRFRFFHETHPYFPAEAFFAVQNQFVRCHFRKVRRKSPARRRP
jgi:hypothetical protein